MTDGSLPLTRHEAYQYRQDRAVVVELKGLVRRLEDLTPEVHVAVSGWLSYQENEQVRVSKSGHSDPTGSQVVAGEVYDDKLEDYRDALRATVEVAESTITLGMRLRKLAGVDIPHQARPGVGDCERCGVKCTGYHTLDDGRTLKDNIVMGLCPACYQRWLRAGRPERIPLMLNPERAWDIKGDTAKWRTSWAGDTANEQQGAA